MRLFRVVSLLAVWGVALACGMGLAATDLHAQGFFQQLFGFGQPAAPPPAARPAPMVTPGGRPYSMPGGSFSPRRSPHDGDDEDSGRGGKFKTVCVRMCDGFYFPISNSTGRRGFYRDQMRCRSACGDDARLFHLPAQSTEIDAASDGQGRIYGLLATAYKYRKSLVAGCQCKPVPWSEAEMARHQQYAIVEAAKDAALQRAEAKQAASDASGAGEAVVVGDSAGDVKAEPVATIALASSAGGAREAAAAVADKRPLDQSAGRSATRARNRRAPEAARSARARRDAPAPAMGLGGASLVWPGEAPRRP